MASSPQRRDRGARMKPIGSARAANGTTKGVDRVGIASTLIGQSSSEPYRAHAVAPLVRIAWAKGTCVAAGAQIVAHLTLQRAGAMSMNDVGDGVVARDLLVEKALGAVDRLVGALSAQVERVVVGLWSAGRPVWSRARRCRRR